MMHLADFGDVIVQSEGLKFVGTEDGFGLVNGPGKVVAIVVEVDVSVLGGIKAAMFAIGKPLVHPADDVSGDAPVEIVAKYLESVNVVFEQFRVVVRHLLEVRNDPALIN